MSDIWHGPPFPVEARQPGPDPERTSYGSFFYFTDPDSNTWLVQEVTTRLRGRMNAAETGYPSPQDNVDRVLGPRWLRSGLCHCLRPRGTTPGG